MINKIKIKPCASLPGQGVKMSNVSQNGGLHGTWWSWIFMWSKTFFKVYIQIIWTTVWYQILIFRILKLLDLQNIAQLKRKRKLIMGAEFVTFDNAVNAMPLLCHVLYEGAAYMAVLKNVKTRWTRSHKLWKSGSWSWSFLKNQEPKFQDQESSQNSRKYLF